LRRRQLLDSACRLLAMRDLKDISLEDVARHAGIPVASAYHFYPDRIALFGAAARRYGEVFAALIARPIPSHRVRRWEDILSVGLDRAIGFYRRNPAARKLLVDPRSPHEIKLADRLNDQSLGGVLEAMFERHFVLPRVTERSRVFFHTVEIADLMMLLSVMQTGRITRAMLRHAHIACCAYLREFIGADLPARASSPPVADVAGRASVRRGRAPRPPDSRETAPPRALRARPARRSAGRTR
jgi:AcrR family transcriptional regulator